MRFLRKFICGGRRLPPQPTPDSAQITRSDLPPVVRELASKDGRFVVLISLDPEEIYRGHGFTWFTHADDDVWVAFWTRSDFGTLTKDLEIVLEEAKRRIETYEN